jgi:hypothetical protein
MARRHSKAITAGAVGAALATALAAALLAAPVTAQPRTVAPDPARFAAPSANRYFPLVPGSIAVLRGVKDGERVVERAVVTDTTKVIQGITATVVHDVLRSHGVIVEKTDDWYAIDDLGDVWYLGEATATYDASGTVISTEGSWEAGVDGAVAGIIMPADPVPTDAFRQEFYRGHAEDQAWIVERGGAVTLPYGTLHHVLRSMEWTRLEADVVTTKLYAPGFGIVKELDLSGGQEVLELVRYTPGA